MADARVWRPIAAETRTTVLLDSLTALYDRRSGQTHLLAAPLPEILSVLDAGPATTADLLARLAGAFDLEAAGEDPAAVLDARLAELAALGLVGDR
jgi:PqqD family protein of HPr-rel-A system